MRIFLPLLFLIAFISGCSKNNNPVSGNSNNNGAYYFTVTFREVGGPQKYTLDTTFNAPMPEIINTPQTPPYQQTVIATYPFLPDTGSDSVKFNMAVSYPISIKTYTDTPYVADSVTLSLLAPSHHLLGATFPLGALTITDTSGNTASGNFNFSASVRGSLSDTLYINGSFYLPYTK